MNFPADTSSLNKHPFPTVLECKLTIFTFNTFPRLLAACCNYPPSIIESCLLTFNLILLVLWLTLVSSPLFDSSPHPLFILALSTEVCLLTFCTVLIKLMSSIDYKTTIGPSPPLIYQSTTK